MRTVRGPVVVAFYRPWSEEDMAFFEALSGKEDEINMAGGSVAGIGVAEPDEAREFVHKSGIRSYVLYDYVKVTSRQWGLLERDKEHGDYSRPAVFIVGPDRRIANAWVGERPSADELLAAVSEITGLPRPAEEEPRPKKAEEGKSEASPGTAKKLSKEERERIKAERRAAREAGKSVKTGEAAGKPEGEKGEGEDASGGDKPEKMTAEERQRIKAERRAAREAGKSLKSPQGSRQGPGDKAGSAEEPSEQAVVEAEVEAGTSGEGEGTPGSSPEGVEAGERREKKRAEEG
jgi:peroxiredoxin